MAHDVDIGSLLMARSLLMALRETVLEREHGV